MTRRVRRRTGAGDARHHQAVSGRGRQRRHRPGRPTRGDPCPPGRERRRQVDAHEHPVRPGTPGRGSDPARRRRRSTIDGPERRDRPGHQHGPSALHARAGADRRREHPAGRRRRWRTRVFLDRREAASTHPRAGERGSASTSTPTRRSSTPVGRLAAAGGDPQGPVSGGPHPGPRRADGRADPAGDRRDLRGAAPSGRRGSTASSSSATSCTRCWRSPIASRSSGAARSSASDDPAADRTRRTWPS